MSWCWVVEMEGPATFPCCPQWAYGQIVIPRFLHLSRCAQPLSTRKFFSRSHGSILISFSSQCIFTLALILFFYSWSQLLIQMVVFLKVETLGPCFPAGISGCYDLQFSNWLCLLSQHIFSPNTWRFGRGAKGWNGGLGIQFPSHPYK